MFQSMLAGDGVVIRTGAVGILNTVRGLVDVEIGAATVLKPNIIWFVSMLIWKTSYCRDV